MFTNLDKNREMILGAYKKLKSYYHYNKNFVFMKEKVAELEYDSARMEEITYRLAELLAFPGVPKNKELVENLVSNINFYVMPKAFTSGNEKNKQFVTSDTKENKAVNKVNFFIDMPIELHLLDTLWTVLLGKLVFDKGIIGPESYGNCIDNYVVYNSSEDFLSSINFSKNKLFKIYFDQYCNWKNNAILTIEKENANKKSQLMFSLDIKGFYYSVFWKFDFFDTLFGNDERYADIHLITDIIQKIFERYTRIISEYRIINQAVDKKEYILPIGLFSSMLLANVYMSDFDKKMKSNSKVLYYGRYVDDMILVIDVSGDENVINDEIAFEKYLVQNNHILEPAPNGMYTLCDYRSLTIQKEKVKMIYLDKIGSGTFIRQLKNAITYPSQMNVIPKADLKLADFEEAVYAKNSINNETKIRDIGQIEIDKFQLGWHMSQIVINNRIKKKYITKEEKVTRQTEGDSILKFFVGSKALEYSSNWINALYYFLLTAETNQRGWNKFKTNIRDAIKNISINQIEDLIKEKGRVIKGRLKKDLEAHFNICIATALALYPLFSESEEKEIISLALKLRKANLFNHNLVSFPLINYADDVDELCDLTSISPEMMRKMDLRIRDSDKSKFSPRFVNIDEIFQFVFLLQSTKGGYYYLDTKYTVQEKLEYIENYFYSVNQINIGTAGHIALSIGITENNDYLIQNIQLGESGRQKQKIKIAIANIKLDIKRCCFGLPCADDVILSRLDLIKFMDRAYAEGNAKVDFLIFPEFYMPLQWVSDVLAFVRKSGITVISGLQYITYDQQAFNNVAIFSPVKTGRYKNAVMLVREKNDYAPLEYEILALEKYTCKDQTKPVYQIVKWNGIEYGIFLCYEFTDITARSLYKNKVDVLFVPEGNKDTSYFSNIIESTVRDLHVFIVQANTSIYGDSRITGPYSRNDRDVLKIKGGDEDDIIIGTIDLEMVRKERQKKKEEFERMIQEYLGLDSNAKYEIENKYFAEQEVRVAKTSARFDRFTT